jgi:ERCC4-type nuclease
MFLCTTSTIIFFTRQSQHQWRDGAKAIEAVRKDIKLTKTGKIYNLPTPTTENKLTRTVHEVILRIIKGEEPIHPRGYTPLTAAELDKLEETITDPYLETKIGKRSGAHAILMAFHHGTIDTSVTKYQIFKVVSDLDLCDSEMDANFHQGRQYGAWKSKDTLIRHGFLQEHKASIRMTDRGFRTTGKHLYSITDAGRRAIQYLLNKWPDTRQCRRPGYAAHFPTPPPSGGGRDQYPFPALDVVRSADPPPKASKLSGDDEKEFYLWLTSAPVMSQRVFAVGKQRRRYLHNVCDHLMQQNPGLLLEHSSQGDQRGRQLYITILSLPTNGFRPSAVSVESMGNPGMPPPSTPARKRLFSETIEPVGQRLGGSSSIARNDQSARDAAAMAAMERFQGHRKGDSGCRDRRPIPAAASVENQKMIVVIDDDDIETHDQKTLPNGQSRAHDYQPGDKVMVMESNGRTRGPFLIVRVHVSGHVTIKEDNGCASKLDVHCLRPFVEALDHDDEVKMENPQSPFVVKGGESDGDGSVIDDDVIDLCDSQQTFVPSNVSGVLGDSMKAQIQQKRSERVTIFIDSRERSRNGAPRELRIGLMRQLVAGSLKDVWPAERPTGSVVEKKLDYGDFAFEVSYPNAIIKAERLSVVVERKLLRDLIQRSARGDHWKQLQRMRDHCEHAIILIENDTQLASRFDAYGSMGIEPNPSHHLIETDADVFRFMGRAILWSRNTRFIQTKDQNGTFRSIGALALMAAESSKICRKAPVSPPTAASEQSKLEGRLTSGGIHLQVAKAIAKEIGSAAALEQLYESCSCSDAKESLLQPILSNALGQNDLGSLTKWSTAIYLVLNATPECRALNFSRYQEIRNTFRDGMPCDPATLLVFVYKENSTDAAVEKALDHGTEASETPIRRKVAIEISEDLVSFFPPPETDSFYTISTNPWVTSVVKFSTTCGNLQSHSLYVYVIEGRKILEDVEAALGIASKDPLDYVATSQHVARAVDDAFSFDNRTKGDRRVVLVRGMHQAFITAAQATSYNDEIRVVCEMIFAALMLEHDYVILQAVRKKDDETKMILQQLALACFHYQFVTNEMRNLHCLS